MLTKRRTMQLLLLTAGAVRTGIGIAKGEPGVVMEKAVRICLECIGIG